MTARGAGKPRTGVPRFASLVGFCNTLRAAKGGSGNPGAASIRGTRLAVEISAAAQAGKQARGPVAWRNKHLEVLLVLALAVDAGCTASQLAQRPPRTPSRDGRTVQPAPRADVHGRGAQEPFVPRVLCMDGSLSITCTREAASNASCCPYQGGVYRDPWGNVVVH